MINKISRLLISLSAFLMSLSLLLFVVQGENLFAQKNKANYEIARSALQGIEVFSYGDLLGLYDRKKGQIYYYKDNIYVKTARIAEPGANLMILY